VPPNARQQSDKCTMTTPSSQTATPSPRPPDSFEEQTGLFWALVVAASARSFPEETATALAGEHLEWLRNQSKRAALQRTWRGYYQALCSHPDRCLETIHLTPSDPNYTRNKRNKMMKCVVPLAVQLPASASQLRAAVLDPSNECLIDGFDVVHRSTMDDRSHLDARKINHSYAVGVRYRLVADVEAGVENHAAAARPAAGSERVDVDQGRGPRSLAS
jgi:hypothetical protein